MILSSQNPPKIESNIKESKHLTPQVEYLISYYYYYYYINTAQDCSAPSYPHLVYAQQAKELTISLYFLQ